MKYILYLPLSFLLAAALAIPALAQESANASSTPEAPITQKDDRFPFMSGSDGAGPQVEEPGSGILVLKSIGAMVLVLGLIFVGAWGARKLGFGNARSASETDQIDLKVLSTVTTGNGRTIAAVSFAGRVLLVGSTVNSFTLLAEEGKAETANPEFHPRSVAEMLRDETTFEEEFNLALSVADRENA